MVGLGMIFDETYRPVFEQLIDRPLYTRETGPIWVQLAALASRTGQRAERLKAEWQPRMGNIPSFAGSDAVEKLLNADIDVVCIATPDDRHFEPARLALQAGKHVLIEKPSVLNLKQLDELTQLASQHQVLAKVVYHKLLDPDHKKLRTHVLDGVLRHVNNGYCSLLEPKQMSSSQFAEWIQGRNPATYVAVHYLKLIDFTFGPDWQLTRISATGQRGLVGATLGNTWDSVQLQVVYTHPDQREAVFDIHTSWVMPDNFPGYVEQEVQFRFDNGIWAAHQRKRGVEICIDSEGPNPIKLTPNHHYNGRFVEPWDMPSVRGYGLEVIERFFHEVTKVEYAGSEEQRAPRLKAMQALNYNDLRADRNCVAIVQALEAILQRQAEGDPSCAVEVNTSEGGLVLRSPHQSGPVILYAPRV